MICDKIAIFFTSVTSWQATSSGCYRVLWKGKTEKKAEPHLDAKLKLALHSFVQASAAGHTVSHLTLEYLKRSSWLTRWVQASPPCWQLVWGADMMCLVWTNMVLCIKVGLYAFQKGKFSLKSWCDCMIIQLTTTVTLIFQDIGQKWTVFFGSSNKKENNNNKENMTWIYDSYLFLFYDIWSKQIIIYSRRYF